MRSRTSVDVCLATSRGGHVDHLLEIETAWARHDHAFVMPDGEQADDLALRGHRVRTIVDPARSPALLTRNISSSVLLARALRPRIVVSFGAGAAIPFCLAARAMGSTFVFIETIARVSQLSASGRIAYPVAQHFLVQWPDLIASSRPRAELCEPLLPQPELAHPCVAGLGTFVATGTHRHAFDRLLKLADDGVAQGLLPRPASAQSGTSAFRPDHLSASATLTPAQMETAVAQSKIVICHGGAGLIALALRHGHIPLVLPREAARGEHVDDHQTDMTRKLAERHLAISLDQHSLRDAVALALEGPRPVRGHDSGMPVGERVAELVAAAL